MRFLLVGAGAVDTVLRVANYPAEDEELRALALRRGLGGNAVNSACVLRQYGHQVSWAGVRGDDANGEWLVRELNGLGIEQAHVKCLPGRVTPSSYINLSAATGSRTIVHYRDLPEYSAEAFAEINLPAFDWVHFEGRPGHELSVMLRRVNAARIPCSLEVEKPREGIEALFELPSLLLCSRPYARSRGFADGRDFLADLPAGVARASCTWGERGAWIRDADGQLSHCAAAAPSQLLDTLAAGDVYNAALLHGLATGQSLSDAAIGACTLAGRACGQYGLGQLVRGQSDD